MHDDQLLYVFNIGALFLSGIILLWILFFHAIYMFFVSRVCHSYFDALVEQKRYVTAQALFLPAAFVLSIAHIIEILTLGYILSWLKLVPNVHKAIVFAGSAYTTVGYGADPLPVGWDLITVTIALAGLITIAWTTSVLFEMSSYSQKARRLERQQKRRAPSDGQLTTPEQDSLP